MLPHLTFFVELTEGPLRELLRREEVLEALQRRGAAVSLAMLDLSPTRARVIRRLNRRQIPVTAWLLLDHLDGYWLTADNAPLAHQRYLEVMDWCAREGLVLSAVGLDIETPHNDSLALVRHGRTALRRLVRFRRSRDALLTAARQYAELIDEIHHDGLQVETYQFPLVVDERRAGSTFLQRVLGFVEVAPDREVLMLYRSLLPGPVGEALVDAYGTDADAIAVGITGGGVPFLLEAVGARRLDLDQVLTDLRRARRYTDRLYVFSLEGCVESGYLQALCDAAPDRPVTPAALAPLLRLARDFLRLLLWAERVWDRVLG